MLILYIVVQNLESYVITPSVMHHQLKLLPGLTLTAQLLFTVLFGPLGLVLALPLAVCLQVILREVLIHDVLDPWKPGFPTPMNARSLIGALALVVPGPAGLGAALGASGALRGGGAGRGPRCADQPAAAAAAPQPARRPDHRAGGVAGAGKLLTSLLLPEVMEQANLLQRIIPELPARLNSLIARCPACTAWSSSCSPRSSWERHAAPGQQLLGFAGGAANSTVQPLLMALLAVLLALDPRSHQRLLTASTPSFYRPPHADCCCGNAGKPWAAGWPA